MTCTVSSICNTIREVRATQCASALRLLREEDVISAIRIAETQTHKFLAHVNRDGLDGHDGETLLQLVLIIFIVANYCQVASQQRS